MPLEFERNRLRFGEHVPMAMGARLPRFRGASFAHPRNVVERLKG